MEQQNYFLSNANPTPKSLTTDESINLITQIISKTELNITVQITESDFSFILNSLDQLTQSKQILYLKSIYNSKAKYIIKGYDSDNLTKYFLILLFLLIQRETDNINLNYKKDNLLVKYLKYIYTLFLSGFLSPMQISLISRYILLFSVIDPICISSEYIHTSYKIKQYKFVKRAFLILKFLTSHEKNFISNDSIYIIENLMDFFYDKFLCERSNIKLISIEDTDKNRIHYLIKILLKIQRDKQENLINKIIKMHMLFYINNYSYGNFVIPFVREIKDLLINIKEKDIYTIYQELSISKFPIYLLSNMIITKEKIIAKEDPFKIKNGFYMDNINAGISTGEVKIDKKEMSIVFGFNLQPKDKNKNSYTIFSFLDTKQLKIKFGIGIVYSQERKVFLLNIQLYKQEIITRIQIEPFKSYVFVIVISKGEKKFKMEFYYSIPMIRKSFDLNDKIIGEFNILEGCLLKDANKDKLCDKYTNDFTGELGTLIVLNGPLDKKIVERILCLRGRYENFITISSHWLCLPDKYYLDDEKDYKQAIVKLRKRQDKFDIDKIICIISPKRFQFIPFDKEQKQDSQISKKQKLPIMKLNKNSNITNNNILPIKIILHSNFHPNFHLFENKRTIQEFLKSKGFSFLCLFLEYYYQLLCKINSDSKQLKWGDMEREMRDRTLHIIAKQVDEILSFLSTILMEIDVLKFNEHIKKVFYQFESILQEVYNICTAKLSIRPFFSTLKELFLYYKSKNISSGNNLLNSDIMECFISLILNNEYYLHEDVDLHNEAIKMIDNLLSDSNISNEILIKLFNFYHSLFPDTQDEKILDKSSQTFFNCISSMLKVKCNIQKKEEAQIKIIEKKEEKKNIFDFFNTEKKKEDAQLNKDKNSDENPIINTYFILIQESQDELYILYNLLKTAYLSDIIGLFKKNNIKQIKDYTYKFINDFYSMPMEKKPPNQTTPLMDKMLTLLIHINLECIIKGDIEGNFHINLQRSLNFSLLAVKSIISFSFALPDKNDRLNWQYGDKVIFDYNEEDDKYSKLTKELFDDIVIMINNASVIGDIEKVDSLIMECLNDISKHTNNNSLFNTIFDMKSYFLCDYFEAKLRLLGLSNKEKINRIEEDIDHLIEPLIIHHKSSFIFNMIYREIKYSDELDYAKELFTKIVEHRILMVLINDVFPKENLKENIINLLVLLETLSIERRDIMFKLFDFKFLLIILHPLKKFNYLTERRLYKTDYSEVTETQPMKLIIEFIFDLSVNLYNQKPNDKILDIILDNIFIENKSQGFQQIKLKEETSRAKIELKDILSSEEIDLNQLEKYKTVFFIMDEELTNKSNQSSKEKNFILETEKQLDNVSISLFFLIKIFVLINKKEQLNKLETLLNGLAKVICWDIAKLYDKSNSFLKTNENSLYNKFKKTIEAEFCKLGKKRTDVHLTSLFKKLKKHTENQLNLEESIETYLLTHPSYSCIIKRVEMSIDDQNNSLGNSQLGGLKLSFQGRMRGLSSANMFAINQRKFSCSPGFDYNTSNNNFISLSDETKIDSKKSFNFISSSTIDDEDKANKSFKKISFPSFKDFNLSSTVFSPKRQLLLTVFSSVFKDVYFNNDAFIHLKQYYLSHYPVNDKGKQLNYPSKLRNFSNLLEPPQFLKQDFNFFASNYLKITHPYFIKFLPKISQFNKNISLFNKPFPEITPIAQFQCELIKFDTSIFGDIKFFHDFIVFNNAISDPRRGSPIAEKIQYIFSSLEGDIIEKEKIVIFFYSEIKEVIIRRFLFIWMGAEIFLKNGKSYFLNFFSVEKCKAFFNQLKLNKGAIIDNSKKYFDEKNFKKQWSNCEISNYNFLLYINKFSSRTFKDASQYPIFPWLLREYSKIFEFPDGYLLTSKATKQQKEKNLQDAQFQKQKDFSNKSLRQFEFPISCQSEEKRKLVILKFNEGKRASRFPFGLGNHYWTSSFLYYYLMRLSPFTQCLIKLQSGQNENPNRMFLSFEDTQYLLQGGHDNREIIPEFFTSIEGFINLNCAYFGYKARKDLVDDIIINESIKQIKNKNSTIYSFLGSYANFIIQHRKILNSHMLFVKIPLWIDWIFGVNQITNKAETCNTFSKTSYELKSNLAEKLEKRLNNKTDIGEIYEKISNKINITLNFGQTPHQLFNFSLLKNVEEYSAFIVRDDFEEYVSCVLTRTFTTNIDNSCVFFDVTKDMSIIYTINCIDGEIKMDLYQTFFKVSEEFIAKLKANNYMKKNSIGCIPNRLLKKKKFKDKPKETFTFPRKPEYTLILLKNNMFLITVNYSDNSFKIQSTKNDKDENNNDNYKDKDKNKDNVKKDNNKIYSIQAEDYVECIAKITEDFFVIGLHNGKLIAFEFRMNDIDNTFQVIEERSVFAHDGAINIIKVDSRLNVLVTSGTDGYIYIRKLYDFELLTSINVKDKEVVSIKISKVNFLYALCYDRKNCSSQIYGFTLNGINFAIREEKNIISCMELTPSGDVLIGMRKGEKIKVLKGGSLEEKAQFSINELIDKSQGFEQIPNEDKRRIISFKLVSSKEIFIIAHCVNKIITIQINYREHLKFFN